MLQLLDVAFVRHVDDEPAVHDGGQWESWGRRLGSGRGRGGGRARRNEAEGIAPLPRGHYAHPHSMLLRRLFVPVLVIGVERVRGAPRGACTVPRRAAARGQSAPAPF